MAIFHFPWCHLACGIPKKMQMAYLDHMEHAPRFHVLEQAQTDIFFSSLSFLFDISLSDFTRHLVVVGRQPYPDSNFVSYVYVYSGRPHRLAVALPHAA